jgi:hypothetical protein
MRKTSSAVVILQPSMNGSGDAELGEADGRKNEIDHDEKHRER